MSRGPGRVERAVEAVFARNPDATFNVDELAAGAYPGVNQVEKKHRVAVIRAADKVSDRLGWTCQRAPTPGHPLIFYNLLEVRSYVLGRLLRCDTPWGSMPLADLEAAVDGRGTDPRLEEYTSGMRTGGVWWLHVEIHKAERLGNELASQELRGRLQERVNTDIARRGRFRG